MIECTGRGCAEGALAADAEAALAADLEMTVDELKDLFGALQDDSAGGGGGGGGGSGGGA